MEWQNPEALYLIIPCCAAWIMLAIYSDRRRQRARESFVARTMWDRILPEELRWRVWFKHFLRMVAIVAGLVAIAGPRFGNEIEQVVPRGSDLYVLIDVSRSMLAEDVMPSRLGRAKADVSALLNRLDGERVGLIAFAGQAVVKCPLTVDYDSFRRALQELDPSSAPRGGTAIGDAIRKALEVFQSKVERDQAILLITDGDDQQSYPLEAAAAAADRQVTIFTVGLGDSDQGSRIPQQSDSTNFVEYQGEQVWSKLDGNLLGEIALKTSGVYVPAGTKAYDLGELYANHLQNRLAQDQATQERSRRSEQYQVFLAIALIALLIDLWLHPFRRLAAQTEQKASSRKPFVKRSDETASKTLARAAVQRMVSVGDHCRCSLRGCNSMIVAFRSAKVASVIATFAEQKATHILALAKGSQPILGSSATFAERKATFEKFTSEPHRSTCRSLLTAIFVVCCMVDFGLAIEPNSAVREGLRQYAEENYTAAREKFAAAMEELDRQKSKQTSIAAFDEACAYHRSGDTEKARESYLRAGLSPDRSVSIDAHFNLGNLSAEKARTQVGEQPEAVEPDKRQEIVDLLMQASASYRHCLELQPEHPQARSNLELVRQWLKYYADKWREHDRQKRRDESNLLVFLEYLLETQTALKASVEALPSRVPADRFAELKQLQSEIAEEIPTLQAKIDSELRPSDDANPSKGGSTPPESSEELEEGIRLLQSWAGSASEHMFASSKSLGSREPEESIARQQLAIEELDKIWEAVVPFHPLLGKELADQTAIVQTLNPDSVAAVAEDAKPVDVKPQEDAVKVLPDDSLAAPDENEARSSSQQLSINELDLEAIVKEQERTLRRSRLLAPKAEMELKQLESQSPSTDDSASVALNDSDPATQVPPVDPAEIKNGLQKAIELAPQAVEHMEAALKFLKQKDAVNSASDAEEARRILEEIQKAQPKNKQPQDQNDQDQQEKGDDQEKKDSDSQKQENKADDDQAKSDDKKQDDQAAESEKRKDQPSNNDRQQQAAVSSDRIEEALRKVRERQEEKHERDRELRAKILGRAPVEKDW